MIYRFLLLVMLITVGFPRPLKAEVTTDGTILIISHQERILEIADRIIVINDGLVEKSGKGEDVIT